MIYLASPHSSPDPDVREQRYREVLAVTARKITAGESVFSPIVYSHHLAKHMATGAAVSWSAWKTFDLSMLRRCDALHVLMLPGWDKSVGVEAEFEAALEMGLPVVMLDCDGNVSAAVPA